MRSASMTKEMNMEEKNEHERKRQTRSEALGELTAAHARLVNALFAEAGSCNDVEAALHEVHASLMYMEMVELGRARASIARAMERRGDDEGERIDATDREDGGGGSRGGAPVPAGGRPGVRKAPEKDAGQAAGAAGHARKEA